MYAVTSAPDVSRTRATLRSAEFGLRGVVVNTRVHTPRRNGEPFRAAVRTLVVLACRPLRTSCAIVGTRFPRSGFSKWPGDGRSGANNRPRANVRAYQRAPLRPKRVTGAGPRRAARA